MTKLCKTTKQFSINLISPLFINTYRMFWSTKLIRRNISHIIKETLDFYSSVLDDKSQLQIKVGIRRGRPNLSK